MHTGKNCQTFADNVAPTTEIIKDMEHQSRAVNKEGLKYGLNIHKRNTKFMTSIYSTHITQKDSTETEKAANYKYLTNHSNGKQNKVWNCHKNKNQEGVFFRKQREIL